MIARARMYSDHRPGLPSDYLRPSIMARARFVRNRSPVGGTSAKSLAKPEFMLLDLRPTGAGSNNLPRLLIFTGDWPDAWVSPGFLSRCAPPERRFLFISLHSWSP